MYIFIWDCPSCSNSHHQDCRVFSRDREGDIPDNLHVYTDLCTTLQSIYINLHLHTSHLRILQIDMFQNSIFLHPMAQFILTNAGLYMQQLWRQHWYSALLIQQICHVLDLTNTAKDLPRDVCFTMIFLTSLYGLYIHVPSRPCFSKVKWDIFDIDVDTDHKKLHH